jgi:hypothetical protein
VVGQSTERRCLTRREGRTGLLVALLLAPTTPSLAQVEASRWTLLASLRETLTDNLFLTDDSQWEAITGGSLSLSYAHVRGGSSFAATGWLGGQLFNRFGTYSGTQFGLNAGARFALSPRARLRVGTGYANGLNLESLRASRVGLPQIDVESGSVSAGLNYALTPSTTADLSLDASGIRYRAQLLVDTSRLPGDTLVPVTVFAPAPQSGLEVSLPVVPDETLQTLGLLTAEGLATLSFDFGTWRAGAALAHDFSPRTRVTIGGDYRRTYLRPETFSAGDQIGSVVTLREVLDRTASLSLSYAYQDNRFGIQVKSHAFTAQADAEIDQNVRFDASFGGSYLDGPNDTTTGWTLIGGVGLSARLKRTSVVARYTRTRYQGLIVARSQVTDLVFAGVGQTLARRVFVSAYGYYRDGRDQLDPRYSNATALVGAALGVRIKQRTRADLSFTFLRFHTAAFTAARRSTLSLSLSYARQMK